jgi:hypothetical protein
MADPFTDLILGEIVGGIVSAIQPEIVRLIREALGLPPLAVTSVEHEPYLTEQYAHDTQAALYSTENGLAAIYREAHNAALDVTAIATALDTLGVQVGNLPIPPSTDNVAAAVWGYPNVGEGRSTYDHLLFLERYGELTSLYGSWLWYEDPMFAVAGSYKYPPD